MLEQAGKMGGLSRALPELSRAAKIGLQPQPVEILEQCGLVLGPAAAPVVVLESQEHSAVQGSGNAHTWMALATWPRWR